jgi:hypothetical protein
MENGIHDWELLCQNCGFCYLDSDAGPQEGSCDGVNEDSLAEYGRYVARVSVVEP